MAPRESAYFRTALRAATAGMAPGCEMPATKLLVDVQTDLVSALQLAVIDVDVVGDADVSLARAGRLVPDRGECHCP